SGYISCSHTGDNSYAHSKNNVTEGFMLIASSFDISGVYHDVSLKETVALRVDELILDFNGTGTLSWHYHQGGGTFAVEILWQRATNAANWAIQMDFGVLDQNPVTTGTTSKSDTTTS
ncbi:hypothetical protein PENTCL1PPCAC_13444, partial [Pristionchus entomophagus]